MITIKTKMYAAGAGLLLCAAGLANAATSNTVVTLSVDMSAQVADSTFVPSTDTVAARGSFNGFGQLFLTNNPSASNTNIYSGTATDTTDPNGGVLQFKYWCSNPSLPNGGYEAPNGGGKNRAAKLPSTSGASLVLPTPFFNDAGPLVLCEVTFQVNMAQQINLGAFIPGTSTVYVRGDFNGYATTFPLTNDPSIHTTNQFGLVSSNVYTGINTIFASTNAAETFKFYKDTGDNWETPGPSNANPDHDGNRFFVNAPQVLPIVDYSDSPYAPIATNNVTFQVDMSAQLLGGGFDPSLHTVDVKGSFNNWSGAPGGLTNNPSAPNTNIYSTVVSVIDGVGVTEQYKFTYSANGTTWESPNPAKGPTIGGDHNRFFIQPNNIPVTLAPVFFSDVGLTDLLPASTEVTFNVNMTGAVGTDLHVFDTSADRVYVNGDWLGWRTWNEVALGDKLLTNNPVGSSNYSLTVTVPKGNALSLTYKYSINGSDNEATGGQNHFRYIRKSGAYDMPLDKFSTQFGEPTAFGELKAGSPAGGRIPLSWLGLPGVHLQTKSDLSSGSWTDIPGTDGTNAIGGSTSANGFVSVTNYPAAGQGYFRLIHP